MSRLQQDDLLNPGYKRAEEKAGKGNISQERALIRGGNLWEKGNMVRVYLDCISVKQFMNFDDHAECNQDQSTCNAKTYLDCKTNLLHSSSTKIVELLGRMDLNCILD